MTAINLSTKAEGKYLSSKFVSISRENVDFHAEKFHELRQPKQIAARDARTQTDEFS